jgi:hypothetical protein
MESVAEKPDMTLKVLRGELEAVWRFVVTRSAEF